RPASGHQDNQGSRGVESDRSHRLCGIVAHPDRVAQRMAYPEGFGAGRLVQLRLLAKGGKHERSSGQNPSHAPSSPEPHRWWKEENGGNPAPAQPPREQEIESLVVNENRNVRRIVPYQAQQSKRSSRQGPKRS